MLWYIYKTKLNEFKIYYWDLNWNRNESCTFLFRSIQNMNTYNWGGFLFSNSSPSSQWVTYIMLFIQNFWMKGISLSRFLSWNSVYSF